MNGMWLALAASVILVFADAGKKELSFRHSTPVIVWNNLILAFLPNSALFLLRQQGCPVSWQVLTLAAAGAAALFVGELCFMTSTRSGDFSMSQPFKAFLPLVALPLGWIFLGEVPTAASLGGVAVCFAGAWLMFASHTEKGILAPFGALFTVPASKWMIISGFFGAVSSCFQRRAGSFIDPLWFTTLMFIFEWIFFGLYLMKDRANPFRIYTEEPMRLIRTGFLWGAGMSIFYLAISSTEIINVYVISQLQPLYALFIARFLFREKAAYGRLLPTLLMISGVIMVVVAG